ncbi:MAG TPA: type II secretion system F family protein [Lacipirellulaceae bacterium]|jgi:type IV pilus assembly protein PilC
MLPSPPLSTKALTDLSHRLAVETESGIDIRRTWQRETEAARGRLQFEFTKIRDAVNRGDSLSGALSGSSHLFPKLFLEMVEVGEQTGTLGRVFHRLSDHYRHQLQLQRSFLKAITWPMIELTFAIFIIGVMILVLGVIAQRNNGQPIDILGFGLVGTRGLVIYINFVIAVSLCVAGLVVAVRRGVLWTRPLQRAVYRVPGLGTSLEKLALARLTWALHLMMNVEMDLRKVVPLVLRSTGSDFYIRHTGQIVADVAAGQPIHLAMARSGAFKSDFIDALQVAEESGQIVESTDRLSRRYQEEAELALQTLTKLAGFAVWAIVAALITLMIFRLAFFYLNTLNNALKM